MRKKSKDTKTILKALLTLFTLQAVAANDKTQSSFSLVAGIPQAELGDLCAKGTLNGPVPCNVSVKHGETYRTYRVSNKVFFDNLVDISISDNEPSVGNITIYQKVSQKVMGPRGFSKNINTNKHVHPRTLFARPVRVEVPAYYHHSKEPAFTTKRPR